ncbi:TMEM63A [Symbiodinium pilosum]|uniref:TMEM63A protein n=1 Tax=Symbiodinium pilosum TaxID=2952 RepID=A0A812N3Z8_SYMPI|nr:TMEM63A [Symbiodinium pilosum]
MPRRTRRTGGGLVSLDGWFVVSEAKPNEDTEKAYDAIEINRMDGCRMEAPGANLLFCLEPKQVANRGEVADCAAVLSGNCRACTERIQKFAQLIGEGGNFAPRSDEQSTVRFDPSWGVSNRAAVHGFVKMKNFWFMVLQGAHLPTDSSWPRGAGMYPTNLKPEAHHHRSKWVSFHSLVVPEETAGSGVPLIGSALLGFPSFRFILDGKEISVSAD